MALPDISQRRSNSVVFGAKRPFREPAYRTGFMSTRPFRETAVIEASQGRFRQGVQSAKAQSLGSRNPMCPTPREAVDAILQGVLPHRSNAEPRALPVKGAPNAFAVVSRVPPVGIPVALVWHGAVLPDVETGADGLEGGITARGVSVVRGANGFVVRATDGGLSPPPPISVEPNGMPTGPTDELDPIPVPYEAIGVDPAKEPPLAAQVPDALPVIPPPSKTAVAEPDAPTSKSLPCRPTPRLTKPRMSCRRSFQDSWATCRISMGSRLTL